MSDGATVYECTSVDEVTDLLAGGQGVFGIAVGRVVTEVQGQLAEMPAEKAAAIGDLDHADELASRRQRRRAIGE
jgi:hypothetical protein